MPPPVFWQATTRFFLGSLACVLANMMNHKQVSHGHKQVSQWLLPLLMILNVMITFMLPFAMAELFLKGCLPSLGILVQLLKCALWACLL